MWSLYWRDRLGLTHSDLAVLPGAVRSDGELLAAGEVKALAKSIDLM